VVAWCAAKASGFAFLVRVEDLLRIPESDAIEQAQIADLAALGITSDRPVVRQSERTGFFADAIRDLEARGLVYPCFCTRREIAAEIAAAATAPHGPIAGHYPGTCAQLSEVERRRREREGRPAALRIRGMATQIAGVDLVAGPFSGVVDDFVVRRSDGVAAYNLAVVIDDAAQGVTQVVRGDDLLESTPRQMLMHSLLGLPTPMYAHVPLVVGSDGERLAKRHGASDGGVTLTELQSTGRSPGDVMAGLLMSTGWVRSGMIPFEIVEEIRVASGPLDLGELAEAVADLGLDDKGINSAPSDGLHWGVTPITPIHRDTL